MYPPGSVRGILSLAAATARSLLVLLRSRPRVSFATGGYVSVPAAVASWLLRIPLVVYLPDVVPGKAVSWLVPLADRIAVTAVDSLPYLPRNKTVVTGYPVREAFLEASRESGRKHFDIPENATVLCVFGGSLGARSLNEALAASLDTVLLRAYVIHVCGEQRLEEASAAAASLPPDLRSRYLLFPYLHDTEMAAALSASNLAVARSGASVLGELPATGTPAVLVPLPDPAVHQRENAEYLSRNGAAVILPNQDLDQLPALLDALLGDPTRLARMADAARALSRRDAAAAIARVIEATA
jgi:UDP-N-acetylglucosamine--N-acetylmuramyl-(pentapeptide) pyrophosphoryl-undecaprenol N-acetylglucosamine transferase